MQAAYDVVVVGSGFGGAVSALRVAQAGKSVLVLERGKDYSALNFPRDMQDVNSVLWQYPNKPESRGLFDIRFFSDVGVTCSSGVGGGSLIYSNIHIRPDSSLFDSPRWPNDINLDSLTPYYDKVAAMLDVSPIPQDVLLPKRDAFWKCANHLKVDAFDPDQAVSWQKCQHCGECAFGCKHKAKNSLQDNYLQQAVDLGVEIQDESLVTIIEPTFKGYYVHYRDLTNGGLKKQVKARRVILAAGTLGTNEILFRNRDSYKTLGDLSVTLGRGFSVNGDFLGTIQSAPTLAEPWLGPDVTSVMKFESSSGPITLALPTFNRAAQTLLASLGQRDGRFLRFIGPIIWRFLPTILPWAMGKGFLTKPMDPPGPHAGPAEQFTNLFAMGRDNANGRLLFHKNQLDIEWNFYDENKAMIQSMLKVMNEIADFYGGRFSPFVTWNMSHKPYTAHPLGGCLMADSIKEGVISSTGEVHDYPGLYVCDGAMIPTAIGYHPVMTITALAERNVGALVDSL
ncbi:hypothetical protein MNBD_GAMMA12-340 [hydrothermal vent metagenome]|uniref:Cholesterol oxidase n=1 Tax=hydrothermal vent metagenome TaxID=652676 RepID=A0A3B0XR38_9ZZZZ